MSPASHTLTELAALLSRLDPLGIHRTRGEPAEREGAYAQLAAATLAHLQQHPDTDDAGMVRLLDELLRFDHGVTLQEPRLDQLARKVHEWASSHARRP